MNQTLAKLVSVFFVFSVVEAYTASPAPATIFEVRPIRLVFKAGNRTDILTVENGSDEKLSLKISAYQWNQDADGKDTYTETKDVLFFPRLLTLAGKEERIVRVGVKIPPGETEKTYRIFVEEIPVDKPLKRTGVRTVLRMGVPIFLEPVTNEVKGVVENLSAKTSQVSFQVSNQGTVHFMIKAIKVSGYDSAGTELFSNPLKGWYVHAGNSKTFHHEIPRDICSRVSRVQVEVATNKSTLSEALGVGQNLCEP